MKLKLLLLLILPAITFSQGISRSAASLRLPLTSFSGATGEAFIADPHSSQSMRTNPANIAALDMYHISFSHTELFEDIRTEYFSLSMPFKYGALGFSISNTGVDGIEYRTAPGLALGTFSAQSSSFQLTYGLEISDKVSIGISPKYLYEKIFVDEATGWGLDLGALYRTPIDGLILGCAFTDIGSFGPFRFESSDLPTQLRIGGAFSFEYDVFLFRTAVGISSELGVQRTHVNLGIEAIYDKIAAVRLGYKTGYMYQGFSTGFGLWYAIAVIDYAFIPSSSQIENAHIISVVFLF